MAVWSSSPVAERPTVSWYVDVSSEYLRGARHDDA
ncbi:hypothetical protein SAMN06265784_103719 [Paraburkholderia susongensis]|uniref:Uncharacterized protein n=1 Tax=Paraburkholderia susongensis TaxID=1515439 RepID=A0A1X7KFZ1_9BURK|nr:hypothetical protein SAMN06265784_103719 [Paraburkholderia susongensis]